MVHFSSRFFHNSQDFVSMETANIAAYEQADLVQKFYRDRSLHKPEQTILDYLRADLKNMKMLDIGVGAGRTTFYFAELVKEYVGIDAASHMIEACKERFANAGQNISFEVCNVRNMQIFEDNYFDFILFSYNGLDLLNHAGRLEALREIRRVCKPGGLFYFSAHNLYSIKRTLTVKWSTILENPRAILYLLKLPIIRLLNPSPEELEKMDYAIIKDGGHRFRIITYYIKPEKQIEQLTELGFTNIKIFSLEDGKEVDINSNLSSVKDFWLHYSCNK